VAGLIFYATFSYLWTSQVIANVALATLAGGPYGAWYYFGPKEMGEMPNHPTLSAFGRASTLSLGSIAFGSSIVTLLELFVGCIESAVEYFNRLVFMFVFVSTY
ncbi:plasma-membrane choline transporter-domain-containing protein, partial [Lentinula guzmanii]